jgi:hypothetical protein
MLEKSEVIRVIFFLPKVLLEFSGIMHRLDDILACWKDGSLVALIPFIASLDIFWCCAKSIDTKELMRYVICLCIRHNA